MVTSRTILQVQDCQKDVSPRVEKFIGEGLDGVAVKNEISCSPPSKPLLVCGSPCLIPNRSLAPPPSKVLPPLLTAAAAAAYALRQQKDGQDMFRPEMRRPRPGERVLLKHGPVGDSFAFQAHAPSSESEKLTIRNLYVLKEMEKPSPSANEIEASVFPQKLLIFRKAWWAGVRPTTCERTCRHRSRVCDAVRLCNDCTGYYCKWLADLIGIPVLKASGRVDPLLFHNDPLARLYWEKISKVSCCPRATAKCLMCIRRYQLFTHFLPGDLNFRALVHRTVMELHQDGGFAVDMGLIRKVTRRLLERIAEKMELPLSAEYRSWLDQYEALRSRRDLLSTTSPGEISTQCAGEICTTKDVSTVLINPPLDELRCDLLKKTALKGGTTNGAKVGTTDDAGTDTSTTASSSTRSAEFELHQSSSRSLETGARVEPKCQGGDLARRSSSDITLSSGEKNLSAAWLPLPGPSGSPSSVPGDPLSEEQELQDLLSGKHKSPKRRRSADSDRSRSLSPIANAGAEGQETLTTASTTTSLPMSSSVGEEVSPRGVSPVLPFTFDLEKGLLEAIEPASRPNEGQNTIQRLWNILERTSREGEAPGDALACDAGLGSELAQSVASPLGQAARFSLSRECREMGAPLPESTEDRPDVTPTEMAHGRGLTNIPLKSSPVCKPQALLGHDFYKEWQEVAYVTADAEHSRKAAKTSPTSTISEAEHREQIMEESRLSHLGVRGVFWEPLKGGWCVLLPLVPTGDVPIPSTSRKILCFARNSSKSLMNAKWSAVYERLRRDPRELELLAPVLRLEIAAWAEKNLT